MHLLYGRYLIPERLPHPKHNKKIIDNILARQFFTYFILLLEINFSFLYETIALYGPTRNSKEFFPQTDEKIHLDKAF